MVRLTCEQHRWHDVEDTDASRIVTALTAHLLDQQHGEDGAEPVCPLEALEWSKDPELYLEHTEARLLGAEIIRVNADGEHEPVDHGGDVVAAANTLHRYRHQLPADVLRTLAGAWSCASAARYGEPYERFWEHDSDERFYATHDVDRCEEDDTEAAPAAQ